MNERDTTRDEATEAARNERTPIGAARQKLAVAGGMLKGFVPRWVNDEGNTGERLKLYLNAGYRFVSDATGKMKVGGDVVTEQGVMKKHVGNNADGSPKIAYLMAIREEWYKEDQALKQKPLDEIDNAIRSGNVTGQTPKGEFYTDRIDYKP